MGNFIFPNLSNPKLPQKLKTKNLLFQRLVSGQPQDYLSDTVDLDPILEECMGNRNLLQELLTLYHQNVLEFIGASKIHLHNADCEALGLAAHKVKAWLAMMRTEGLHAIVVQVQKECDDGKDMKHLQFLCDRFAMEYPSVNKNLDVALGLINRK
jgi:hypothetical protein